MRGGAGLPSVTSPLGQGREPAHALGGLMIVDEDTAYPPFGGLMRQSCYCLALTTPVYSAQQVPEMAHARVLPCALAHLLTQP